MSCTDFDRMTLEEEIGTAGEEALARHLARCPGCAARARRDARLADPLVAAAAAAGRWETARRRALTGLTAAALVAAFALALRTEPAPRTLYVIRGDATGVTLTGPGVARRGETLPPVLPRKGDRT